jgi:multimeric flavodoxin WrbA
VRITILNGNPDPGDRDFDGYLKSLDGGLKGKRHEVKTHTLREMKIRYCVSCWNCWFKTPGICRFEDSMPDVYRSVVAEDLVIFASPVIMGFTSALLKRASERLIPLLLPHVDLVQGENHHRGRYERVAAWGLVLQKNPDTDDEDIRIISDIYRRETLSFKTSLKFTFLTDKPVKEACDAIDAL